MKETMCIKKLDAVTLQRLLRCDPTRIQAEEATSEAIETCRLMGVELLLAPSAAPGGGKCVCGQCHSASQAPRRDARKARKLGVCMVFAKSDISGLKRASPEEVENIVRNLANAQTRVHLNVDEHDEAAMRAAGSVSAGDAKSYGERVTSTIHNHRVSDTLAKRLKSAGYIPGQTYEQCCNMALWHPEMASVMETINNKGLFYLVTKCMPQPGLHHEVVLGKTGIGKKDVLLSFADDLHEVFSKHEMLVAAGRAEGIQLAVSRELLDMLSQHVGADGYLGNLHVI